MLTQEAITKIKTSEAFIALITPHFLKDEKCLEECKLAEELHKPMYAIIIDKETWEILRNRYDWRKEYDPKENFTGLIKKDLQIIRAVNDA